MITETITFNFETEEQQRLFHARLKGMDIVERARDYLSSNAAESGADVLIAELVAEVETLRDAARKVAI
jgi:hypothetical protein